METDFTSGGLIVSPPDSDGDIHFEMEYWDGYTHHYMKPEKIREFIAWLQRVTNSAGGES